MVGCVTGGEATGGVRSYCLRTNPIAISSTAMLTTQIGRARAGLDADSVATPDWVSVGRIRPGAFLFFFWDIWGSVVGRAQCNQNGRLDDAPNLPGAIR